MSFPARLLPLFFGVVDRAGSGHPGVFDQLSLPIQGTRDDASEIVEPGLPA
jgi:hypothetical protein